MKKLILFLVLVCFGAMATYAQDAKPASKEVVQKEAKDVEKAKKDLEKARAEACAVKKDAEKAKAEANAAKKDLDKAKAEAQQNGAPTKKDGTPDMRYKENKEAAKAVPVGPVKKDGTPDMRYKENKKVPEKAK